MYCSLIMRRILTPPCLNFDVFISFLAFYLKTWYYCKSCYLINVRIICILCLLMKAFPIFMKNFYFTGEKEQSIFKYKLFELFNCIWKFLLRSLLFASVRCTQSKQTKKLFRKCWRCGFPPLPGPPLQKGWPTAPAIRQALLISIWTDFHCPAGREVS